ncbi:Hsp70 family protein [Nocardia sp. R6R-6]|uniref:Hsp70 family protein n=1 Tax=Nocardia sp. R6R-6 TaxID=3459303 RepID=UPI00403DFFEB
MTTGLGFSIGTVNSVTAWVTTERVRPVVRSRRTAVTFDSGGGLRLGGIAQFSVAVTDFADLGSDPDTVIVGGRIWSPAGLIAAVVNELRAIAPAASEAGVVTTYPATYSDKQVALLRQALELSGAGDVLLVPEPVAAAQWLEHEYGPLETGFVLVYDLGGTSLDVTIVRVGPDWDNHPMVGEPLRSYDFGGRPLGAMIARYAPDVSSESARLPISALVDIDGLRVAHVRDSLDLVRDCVRSAGITMSDISRILLVGGASRPAEVARTLAELGRPVVLSADPGQTVAAGAALMAARTMALGAASERRGAPRTAVFSSAAVVSAVAMSAVTVFGGPDVPELSPVLDRVPNLEMPADNLLFDMGGEHVAEAWSRMSPTGWNSTRVPPAHLTPQTSAYTRFITPEPYSAGHGPSVPESRIGLHGEPRDCCTSGGPRHRSDPADFANPLLFEPVVRPAPKHPAGPPAPGQPGGPVVQVPGAGLPDRPAGPGQQPAPHPGVAVLVPSMNLPIPQGEPTALDPNHAPAPIVPGATSPDLTDNGTSGTQGSGTGSGGPGSFPGKGSPDSSSPGGVATGGVPSGTSDETVTGPTSVGGATGNWSSGGPAGHASSGGSGGHGSSGGSAGGSSTGGSASSGGSATGHSSDASTSGGSSSRSGPVGGSKPGGSAAGNGRTGGRDRGR